MSRRGLVVALVSLSLGACQPFECDDECEEELEHRQGGELRVMTQNLDLGVDLSATLAIPVEQIPAAAAEAFLELQASDFPTRARELALEIRATSPHLIGLQEAELIRVQSPGDTLSPNPTAATEVAADYLQILLGNLAQLGLCYRVAVLGEQTDLELPALIPGQLGYQDVRVTDRDAILARCDVGFANAEAHHYLRHLEVPIGDTGLKVEILRGWQEVDVTLGERTFHVANTHLEPAPLPPIELIQVAQATELLTALADERLPVVLVGDFNSAADGSTTPTWRLVLAAGFADAWRLARDGEPGYTCCQTDLRDPVSALSERIDYVFVRDVYDLLPWRHGGVSAELVGDQMLPGFELWPSDHAGLVATFRVFAAPLLARVEEQPRAPRPPHPGPAR